MSGVGKDTRARYARIVGAKFVLIGVVLLAAMSLSWRSPAVSDLEHAGATIASIIRFEVKVVRTARIELGNLLEVLDRNVRITHPQSDCIQSGCPAHLGNGEQPKRA